MASKRISHYREAYRKPKSSLQRENMVERPLFRAVDKSEYLVIIRDNFVNSA